MNQINDNLKKAYDVLEIDIEKTKGNHINHHPLHKHFKDLMNDVDKWAKHASNEDQFRSNLHGSIQSRTGGKHGIRDASEGQLKALKDKWLDIHTKGASKT